jgi:hypothetical protein
MENDRNSAKAGAAVQVRVSGALFAAIENWRRQQLRELLGQALAHRSSATRIPGRKAP